MHNLIPKPVLATPAAGSFTIRSNTKISVTPGTDEMLKLGHVLADVLQSATGFATPVAAGDAAPDSGGIWLSLAGAQTLGGEGYALTISSERVTLSAAQPAGIFRGVQTLRQLLPLAGAGVLAAGEIRDTPRFGWRGVMLDVCRHFFGVDDVKRVIDLMAHFKLNVLHLHLSDDQGWRIEIKAWPKLTEIGGSTQVGGGKGGYYTQVDYAELVAYAQERYITIVPEIDMPGHTNAALASYAELNCDGVAREPYTGTEVGFSSLCTGKELTYQFLDDVIGELAALTAGPYIHIGGDETAATKTADFIAFIERVQGIVEAHGKQVLGWEEIGQTKLRPGALVQQWNTNPKLMVHTRQAVAQGARVILSPANRVYLDMKYTPETSLGATWAGIVDVQDAYAWDPATLMAGVSESDIAGVEAPLWTETCKTIGDVEFFMFPRVLGAAEIAWSPATGRDWDEYKVRLGAQGPRLRALGVNFYRSRQVPWA